MHPSPLLPTTASLALSMALAALVVLGCERNAEPGAAGSPRTQAASSGAQRPTPASPAGSGVATPLFLQVKHPARPGRIVPASAKVRPGDFFDNEIDANWTPSSDDISRLEAGLAAHLTAKPPPRSSKLHERLSSYHRQYVGLVMGGSRRVYASFHCKRPSNWDRQWAAVSDGGDCYFQVLWDAESGEYLRVTVNGEA